MTALWTEALDDEILVATYHNPPMNYFTQAATDELADLVEGWRDTHARVIVLTGGVPGKFVTHFDVEQILDGMRDPFDVIARGPVRNTQIDRILATLAELPQPVIAALNGDAMGFGFELALACDLRIAERGDYRIGPCEVALGIIPGAGGTQRLARTVGLAHALDLVLRAKVLGPDEAAAEGLLSGVTADALEGAMSLARSLAAMPRQGIAMAKRSLHLGAELPLSYALQIESDASLRTKFSSTAREAMERYLELPLERRRDFFDAWRRAGEWANEDPSSAP